MTSPLTVSHRHSPPTFGHPLIFANRLRGSDVLWVMSSQNRNECTPLREAQRNYRRAWNRFTTEVESFQSALNQGLSTETVSSFRERVDHAAGEYRIARDELAQVLLAHDVAEPVTIDLQLDRVTARSHAA